jgi:uncharacterized protein YjiS (DUF1127 family)
MTLATYLAAVPQDGAVMPAEPAKSGLLDYVQGGWMAVVAAAQRRLALQRARRELQAMPDRALKDFGIDRSEIEWRIRCGRDGGR